MMGALDVTVGSPQSILGLLQANLPSAVQPKLHVYAGAGHNWFKEDEKVAEPGYAEVIKVLLR